MDFRRSYHITTVKINSNGFWKKQAKMYYLMRKKKNWRKCEWIVMPTKQFKIKLTEDLTQEVRACQPSRWDAWEWKFGNNIFGKIQMWKIFQNVSDVISHEKKLIRIPNKGRQPLLGKIQRKFNTKKMEAESKGWN